MDTKFTINYTNKSNNFNPSYNIVFILKENIRMDDIIRWSDNIPNWGTYSLLWDSRFIIKHQVLNIQ